MLQKSLVQPKIAYPSLPSNSLQRPSSSFPRVIFQSVRSEAASTSYDEKETKSKILESPAVSGGTRIGRDPNVKKPPWLRQRAPQGEKFLRLHDSLSELKLNTVCVEAQCPNIGEVENLLLIYIYIYILLSYFYFPFFLFVIFVLPFLYCLLVVWIHLRPKLLILCQKTQIWSFISLNYLFSSFLYLVILLTWIVLWLGDSILNTQITIILRQ